MFSLINICKSFDKTTIYENFNLILEPNRVNVLLGPSGCGKSTLLNIVAGLIKPDSGELKGFLPTDISYLFQEPRLLPWKTVLENITYILDGHKSENKRVAKELLKKVGLENVCNLFPGELSGGMAKRVSIARAFAFKSKILILDEPFASLDSELKTILINVFKDLWIDDKRTVICVTHDLTAAREIGHKIVTLSNHPVRILDSICNIDREN